MISFFCFGANFSLLDESCYAILEEENRRQFDDKICALLLATTVISEEIKSTLDAYGFYQKLFASTGIRKPSTTEIEARIPQEAVYYDQSTECGGRKISQRD